MRFEVITPDNVHAPWPYVRRGLERVIEVAKERWLPEDIFTHLRIGRAQLYLGYEDDHCRGFFIMENKKDPFTNAPYLNVWVLWGEPTTGDNFAGVEAFVAQTIGFIDDLARTAKAQWIAMDGRRGWERYLRDYFKPIKVHYEREVDHGR